MICIIPLPSLHHNFVSLRTFFPFTDFLQHAAYLLLGSFWFAVSGIYSGKCLSMSLIESPCIEGRPPECLWLGMWYFFTILSIKSNLNVRWSKFPPCRGAGEIFSGRDYNFIHLRASFKLSNSSSLSEFIVENDSLSLSPILSSKISEYTFGITWNFTRLQLSIAWNRRHFTSKN